MRRVPSFLLLTFAVAALSACATTQARTNVVAEPLVVPPVPARVLVPEIEEVALPSVDEPAAAPARTAPARDPKTPEKTETKPEEPAPAAPPARTEDTPRVRTPQTANNEQAEREVRAIMARAKATLDNVDYRALSQAARQQYDTAKRFINQANSALTIRNYVFARNLADKADTLARQLGK